eukprot:2111125-Rhodomonas_salina.8
MPAATRRVCLRARYTMSGTTLGCHILSGTPYAVATRCPVRPERMLLPGAYSVRWSGFVLPSQVLCLSPYATPTPCSVLTYIMLYEPPMPLLLCMTYALPMPCPVLTYKAFCTTSRACAHSTSGHKVMEEEEEERG